MTKTGGKLGEEDPSFPAKASYSGTIRTAYAPLRSGNHCNNFNKSFRLSAQNDERSKNNNKINMCTSSNMMNGWISVDQQDSKYDEPNLVSNSRNLP